MMSRVRFLTAVAMTLITLAGSRLLAVDATVHDATVVETGDGKVALLFEGHEQKRAHAVAKDAVITLDDMKAKLEAAVGTLVPRPVNVITLDDMKAKLEELKGGFSVKVVMDDKHVLRKIAAHAPTAREYVLTVEGIT